jgi:glycosyltransferase involved in cell wall biosynthesis
LAHVFEQADRFDIIHNQADFPAHAFSGFVATPMVTTIHGFSSERILPMYKPYENRIHYVAISEADRHPDLRYAATIHHGIPVEQFPLHREGGDNLLFFGRIHPHKGTREAIEVARACGRKLDIYGVIQDQAYFDEQVAPDIDGRNVIYHGPVGGRERVEALGQAHALLHLISFDEPFGLSVIEAMACGTPVIAIRRGSMSELIDDGRTGFLVETAEEAVGTVGRVAELDRTEISRETARRFGAERMADEYLALYQRILAGHSDMRPDYAASTATS